MASSRRYTQYIVYVTAFFHMLVRCEGQKDFMHVEVQERAVCGRVLAQDDATRRLNAVVFHVMRKMSGLVVPLPHYRGMFTARPPSVSRRKRGQGSSSFGNCILRLRVPNSYRIRRNVTQRSRTTKPSADLYRGTSEC